jgi:hypothetical protein
VLAEDLCPPEAPALPPARVEGGVLHASVALVADATVIVNVGRGQLEALSAKEGELLKLTLAGGTHTVAIGAHDEAHKFTFLNAPVGTVVRKMLQKLGTRCFAAKGAVPKGTTGLAVEVLPAGERSPLLGCFGPESSDALNSSLRLLPMSVTGESSEFDWAAPPAVGTAVELRRGTPPRVRRRR